MLCPCCGCVLMDTQHWVYLWFCLQHYPFFLWCTKPMSPGFSLSCPGHNIPEQEEAVTRAETWSSSQISAGKVLN